MSSYNVNKYVEWLSDRDDVNRLLPNVAVHALFKKYKDGTATDDEIAQLNRFAMNYLGQPALYEQFVEDAFDRDEPICTMNKVPYLTIQDAIDCAGSLPSTIYVTGDIEQASNIMVGENDTEQSITIDLCGCAISGGVSLYSGKLNIFNGTLRNGNGGLYINGKGDVYLKNVNISGAGIGIEIFTENSSANMTLENVVSNVSEYGVVIDKGAEEGSNCSFTVIGGTHTIDEWYVSENIQESVDAGEIIHVDESSVFPNGNKYGYLSQEKNYFYVENPGDESIDCIVSYLDRQSQSTPEFMNIEVSNDKETWTSLEFTLDPESSDPVIYNSTIPIAAGEKLYVRCITDAWMLPDDNVMYCIRPNGESNVGGNIMSLLYGENFEDETTLENNYAFSGLFAESAVANASELILPATTLTEGCYSNMFYGCTSLTAAPELPAQNLTVDCYSGMFNGCTSLTTAPELPAQNLDNNCYQSMFRGCTSLTAAPELPAQNLIAGCYYGMFNGCTSLNEVTSYAQSVTTNALEDWLEGVAKTGTFYNLGGATYEQDSASGIPTGWTEETEKLGK